MTTTYTTKAGDMWDQIAYRVYGSESHTTKLMTANTEYAHYFILPANLTITVPELDTADVTQAGVAPWKR